MKESFAYLAGIIDGEGYLGLTNQGKQMRLVVTSTDERLPLHLAKITGKGYVKLSKRKHDGRRIPSWQWLCFKREEVLFILQQINDFVIIKREHVKCLLTYATYFKHRFGSRTRMSQEEMAIAIRFGEMLRSINSREKNKTYFRDL